MVLEDATHHLLVLIELVLVYLGLVGPTRRHERFRGVRRAHVVVLEAVPALPTRALWRVFVARDTRGGVHVRRLLWLMGPIVPELEPADVTFAWKSKLARIVVSIPEGLHTGRKVENTPETANEK